MAAVPGRQTEGEPDGRARDGLGAQHAPRRRTGGVVPAGGSGPGFGLTEAAGPVFQTALMVWFAVLSAAYRFRLLDRALGLGSLPEHGRR